MKKFKEFGIKPTATSFVGDKVNIEWVLNKPIIIHDFKIEPSKYGADKKRVCLQVSIDNKKHIIFSGSGSLMDMIQQVPKNEFPFESTITKEDKRFQFT